MLIQGRADGLRLITQHDHGLLSGELAVAWRGPGGGEEPAEELVLAVSLHDLSWRELDAVPRRDPATGLPYDFLRFPADEKYEAASRGIDRVAELHPYAGVLVSLHYCTFGSPRRPSEFEESEEERRLELLGDMEDEAPGPSRIRHDMDFLRLFDNLSLLLCLTPPGADEEHRPSWLTPDLLTIPGGGPRMELSWRDDGTAVLNPFPFQGPELDVELPFRDLPPGPFASDEALRKAWEEAPVEIHRIRLRGGI